MFERLKYKFKRKYAKFRLYRKLFSIFSNVYFHRASFERRIWWILDPILDRVEPFAEYFGTLFVITILVLLFCYVFVAYYIGVPYWNERSPLTLKIAFTIGHWLLLNVCWNYYKALMTDPGRASERIVSGNDSSFCKKCEALRPARSHHCSVCKRCILKMDHHCPWLNNCIGLRNHRYFILFCFYVWIGTFFIIIFGVTVAIDLYFPKWSPFATPIFYEQDYETPLNHRIEVIGSYVTISSSKFRERCIIFETILTVILFIVVFFLLRYHCSMITNGQTCIESHINAKQKEKLFGRNKLYTNPYDHGPKENWRRFLNVDNTLFSWMNVLLPSEYIPDSDGFQWNTNIVV